MHDRMTKQEMIAEQGTMTGQKIMSGKARRLLLFCLPPYRYATRHIMRHAITFTSAIIIFSSLTACGGGGGGGGGSSPTATPQSAITTGAERVGMVNAQLGGTATPAQSAVTFDTSAHDFDTEGTPSTQAAALSALERIYNPLYRLAAGTNFGTLTQQRFNNEIAIENSFQAAADTRAHQAWAQGWTGKDVKVGHLDDFTTIDDLAPYTHGQLTRFVTQQIAPEIDHDDQQITLNCFVTEQQQLNQAEAGYNYFNTNGYHIVNNSFASERYDDGSCPGRNPGLLSDTDWRMAIDEAARNNIFLQVAQSTGTAGSYDVNMLFVYGAGNAGQDCTGGIVACNLYAAAVHRLRDNGDRNAGERVMFVGALADGSNNIADYSITAGEELKYDYMVAHDDVDSAGDLSGTSFSTPRVAGAAALVRHKFPNLNGAALKQVLLQTSDDLGQRGVDNIFGYGKLNILNALSPIGRVTSQ